MGSMGMMPMPGGLDVSMTWMRMPGQTWPGAALSFLAMWIVMMVAMMLPSFIPMLYRYSCALGRMNRRRLGLLTALVSTGYFSVWSAIGAVAYPVGVGLTSIEMRQPALSRAVPLAVSVIVLIAGASQFTTWKAHHLACCREAPQRSCVCPPDTLSAWRHGLRLGLHCSCSCAGLTAILLVVGVMDSRLMACVTAAITIEHLAPAGFRIARAIGVVVITAGLALIVSSLWMTFMDDLRRF